MRLTIERIRTLVLIAAVVLLIALGFSLARAKWRNLLVRRDMPQRLAKEIQQEANGFDYVHAFGAHSQYKIHASKEVQLRNNHIELHEVRIELFGDDGKKADQIDGDTFEFDQKSGLAIAEGPVEMILTRPAAEPKKIVPGKNLDVRQSSAQQVHVKTSGVTFDRDSGQVSTAKRVDFNMAQGAGSATGAIYDSQSGHLTLESDVELTTHRGNDSVTIRAQHAEFDRGTEDCVMRGAVALYRDEQANVGVATINFREDGSPARLNAQSGFVLTTQSGGNVAAPEGSIDFDERNQPLRGHLQGGVTMDSVRPDRTVHGKSPAADLEFAAQGRLRHVHMERGIVFASDETSKAARLKREWHSQTADIEFRDLGGGRIEPASLHGTGNVTIASNSERAGSAAAPSKLRADDVVGIFGPNATLQSMIGTGHATLEDTTPTGALQTASGNKMKASFASSQNASQRAGSNGQTSSAGEVETAELEGDVVLLDRPAPKPGGQTQSPMRATAGKAVYEGNGNWLHLTMGPRIVNGALEVSAEKVDVSQQSDDAFAHGNVKATWSGGAPNGGTSAASSAGSGIALGGRGPAHVVADDAQVNRTTGEATFHGHARLWQEANSVSGPILVLNQRAQTLTATSHNASDPVQTVMLNNTMTAEKQNGNRHTSPAVIRVRGGDLWYSDAEHRAVMHGGSLKAVIAEVGEASSTSDQVELRMTSSGSRGSSNGTQVDRLIATGHVVLSAQGRRGVGEKLAYTGADGDYALTGTPSAPPRFSDPQRGSVTGQTLIFHSRDDSVSIEGGGLETHAETTAPDVHGK